MKLHLIAVAVASVFMFSCSGGSNQSKAEATEAKAITDSNGTVVAVDSVNSTIEWIGYKPTGKHFGTINLKNGEFKLTGDQITGGTFIFDMNTIQVKDLDDKSGKTKLEAHLKGPDFFDVAKNPEAKFEITKVTIEKKDSTTHLVEGNLTIRGNTKGISFPAKISLNDDGKKVKATASFKIDRTEFGIVYHSKKDEGFMKEFEKMKDKLINNEIDLKLNVSSVQ
jgi:polyisoprenoid-binding protein YceI